jgi:hypothetical protein
MEKMDSTIKMPNRESMKKSRQRSNRKERETEQEAHIRRKNTAEKKAKRRSLETPHEASIRRKKDADRKNKRRKIETPQQYQQRIESYREYNSKKRNWNIGRNGNNGKSGISLEEEFKAEVIENVNFRNVPMITEKVEIEVPMSMAFQHIMKTKIGHDELIPDNIMEQIHQLLSREENGEKIEIPLYDQIHQANVCVICDRFITGTAELNWIKKITLLQHKSRLVISDINSELQQCYQIGFRSTWIIIVTKSKSEEKWGISLLLTV